MNKRLDFDTHVTNICNRVSKKLYVLPRISQFMSILKRRITMKAFMTSEFGCCPLVRMFHIRKLKSRIDKLRESALRIIFQDQTSSFIELLEIDNSTTIHNRNVQFSTIKWF